MYTAIMKTENIRVTKLQDGFANAEEAQLHVDDNIEDYPDAFALPTPDAPVHWWRVGSGNDVTVLEPAPSGNPNDYIHTRRQFKMLLTDAMEDEIKSIIQAATTTKLKREIRAFFEDEQVFTWGDPTMVKIRNRMDPAIAEAFEADWIA